VPLVALSSGEKLQCQRFGDFGSPVTNIKVPINIANSSPIIGADHMQFSFIMKNRLPISKLTRFILAIQNYNFVNEHILDQSNVWADALSRNVRNIMILISFVGNNFELFIASADIAIKPILINQIPSL
jgi:hypothetical protein